MSVAGKIVQIMQSIGAIKDDVQNTYQGFSYASADMILTVARSHMANVGLACIPAMTNITMTDSVYLISYEFTLVDVDDPEHYMVQQWAQSIPIESKSNKGNYLDDKAIGKATTYAHKYFLMKLFLISDKDDVDIDGSDPAQYDKHPPQPPQKPKVNSEHEIEQMELKALIKAKKDLLKKLADDPTIRGEGFYENYQHLVNTMKNYKDEFGAEAIDDGFVKVTANLLNRKQKETAS